MRASQGPLQESTGSEREGPTVPAFHVRAWEVEQDINIWHHNCSEISKRFLGAAGFGERRWGEPPQHPPVLLASPFCPSHFPKTPGHEGSGEDCQYTPRPTAGQPKQRREQNRHSLLHCLTVREEPRSAREVTGHRGWPCSSLGNRKMNP